MSALKQPRAYSIWPSRVIKGLGYAVIAIFAFVAFSAHAQKPLGIDVSHWQGTGVNWNSVKNSGVTFAWTKATESNDYTDDTYATNQFKAKAAGVYVGSYHYARPDLNLGTAGADAEAAYFWSVAKNYIKGTNTYLMPVLDIEHAPGASYTKATLSQWVNQWCSNVVSRAASNGVVVKPIVYTYVSYSSTWLNSTVTNWPLWMANYNGQSPQTGAPSGTSPWSTWDIWQYSSTNTVPGVSGNCDADVYNGTAAAFAAKFVIGGANSPYFISQPSSRTADRGGSLSLRVEGGGAATLKYQWRLNGTNISAATSSSLTLTNIQTTNAGNYTVVMTNSYGSITSSVATLTVNGLFTPIFTDNFETNSSANWTLNRSSTDTRVTFAYDYSGIGVAAAPNSSGTTKGLRMEANLSAAATAALNVSPIGKSFGGNYRLHFDMWINANGPFPGGGTGSTELVTAGIGTAGNRVQWNGTISDGVWFAVDGEGGAVDTSTTQGDFLAYSGTNQQAVASGVYLAGTDTSARSDGDTYYQNVFFGGQTAPAAQQSGYAQQTGSLDPGTVGFAWRDVVINKNGNTVEWFIDGLKIASMTGTSITASNIFVGYWDPYTSVSDNTNLSFGLIDNLRVEVPVVAPAISNQPQSLTVVSGSNATFSVVATGTPAASYQWRFFGTNISGATSSSYTKTNVQISDAGTYSVIVTNVGGSVTSSNANLTVVVPPVLTQPANQTVNVGDNVSFSVVASGTAPFSYQWKFNNADISGATTNSYSIIGVQPSAAGSYSVVVTNVAGATVSSNALLTVMQMQFAPASITLSNGSLLFGINGAPGTYMLEASSNLLEWLPVATLTNVNGAVQFNDPIATNTPDRFYRIKAQ